MDPLLVELQPIPKEIVATFMVQARFPFEQFATHRYASLGESECGSLFQTAESPVSNEVNLSISSQMQ
jgi:hypothetical protein